MQLSYKKICFVISFAKKVSFIVPASFLFRSIIGYQLRKMCCISRNSVCSTCMFSASCIYGLTFETIVPKDNKTLTGRDRISHPIIISADSFAEKDLDSILLQITFLGNSISYIPYFFYALKKGGESGIMKERIPYKVNDIVEFQNNSLEKRSLVIDENRIETNIQTNIWEYIPEQENQFYKKLSITLVSPLRFKSQGHYVKKLNAQDFAQCLHRRTQVLCSQYGHNDFRDDYHFLGNWNIIEENTKWRDFVHYSARQKETMQLGGIMGRFTISGTFSLYEYSFLQFAECFHAGKNTNFGLGKLRIEELYD